MRRIVIFLRTTVLITACIFIFTETSGIPSFARKYQISCQVCHSPAPRLKPFGEEFAGNGFRLTEYESPRYFIQTGDEKLSLLRDLPFAIRIDGIGTYNFGKSKTVDFAAPSGIKLLSGGELSDKLSYYFYFFMSEGGTIAGIEDAFLMYSDLFGTGINLFVGQFQACDPFYKRELRLTIEDIAIIKAAPGQSKATLKYERGIMAEYTIPKLNTSIVAEVVNGNGLGNGGEEMLFDSDSYKNVLARLSQPIGDRLTLGVMGYTGKERLNATDVYYNSVRMIGPVINIDFDQRLMMAMQYIRRTDTRVFNEETSTFSDDVVTQGGYFEATLAPKGDRSNFYYTALLNYVDSGFGLLNYKSATLNISYLLNRNIRLMSEYTWLSAEDEYGKLSLGFVSAF